MKAEADQKTAEINRQTLQEKAEADRKTAELALRSEDVKLQIAEEELRQHRQDADDLKTKDQNVSVAGAIDHMFAANGGSEGNLAVLFRYSQVNPALRDLIINAVVVRLSEPRSVEEIRLGLRLLNHIGLSSLPGLVEINRNARNAYDDILFDRFKNSIFSQWQQLGSSEKALTGDAAKEVLFGLALRASSEVTDRAHTPARYVRATLFRRGDRQIGLCEYMLEKEQQELGAPTVMERLGVDRVTSDNSPFAVREELLAELMLQSRLSISELVGEVAYTARRLDLSRTYLGDIDWKSGHYPPLRLDSAYISGDSFDGVHFSGKATTIAKADRIELRKGVITPSQEWPRFVEPSPKDWFTTDTDLNLQIGVGKPRNP
jgi:hypothetical protein